VAPLGDEEAHRVGDVVDRAQPPRRDRLDELAQHCLRRLALGGGGRFQEPTPRAVWMRPGARLFTRMFNGPTSMDSSLLNIRIAALHALPGVWKDTSAPRGSESVADLAKGNAARDGEFENACC
jgi:hypothetical protein